MPMFDDLTGTEATIQHVKDDLVGTLNLCRASYDNGQRLVWQNPYGLTAQEVFDAVGTQGGLLVRWATALATFINRADVPVGKRVTSLKPANCTVTINANGTVTLTYS